jgi:hypothetical protein
MDRCCALILAAIVAQVRRWISQSQTPKWARSDHSAWLVSTSEDAHWPFAYRRHEALQQYNQQQRIREMGPAPTHDGIDDADGKSE